MSAREYEEVADMRSLLKRRGKSRGYLFFGHELMGPEGLLGGKVG